MSNRVSALGAETGVDLGSNILGFEEFQAVSWTTEETIGRLAEGER